CKETASPRLSAGKTWLRQQRCVEPEVLGRVRPPVGAIVAAGSLHEVGAPSRGLDAAREVLDAWSERVLVADVEADRTGLPTQSSCDRVVARSDCRAV